MRKILLFASSVILVSAISSCEFKCNIGNPEQKAKDQDKLPEVKEGATIYNKISLKSEGLKINKAYLVLDNGERVPANNFVDFTIPVKMIVLVDSGWTVKDGQVFLGASEKITA